MVFVSIVVVHLVHGNIRLITGGVAFRAKRQLESPLMKYLHLKWGIEEQAHVVYNTVAVPTKHIVQQVLSLHELCVPGNSRKVNTI